MCPIFQSDYSFVVFECKYPGKLPLPFRMAGDCPVVVTAILQNSTGGEGVAQEGNLIDIQGEHAEWLTAFGLVPAIGDVVVALDTAVVTHLNSNQCKRLVKKKRTEIRSFLSGRAFVDLTDEPMISVTFRRHYLKVAIVMFFVALFYTDTDSNSPLLFNLYCCAEYVSSR